MKQILLIPKIQIQNANALSSPYTIGFPAMTAWLGAVHALQRHLNQGGMPDVCFNSVAVVCHSIDLKTYRGQGDFINSIIGTGNPLTKEGNRPAFIEEARCHLIVSLAIEYQGLCVDDQDKSINKLNNIIHSRMKMAGGDVLGFDHPEFFKIDGIKEFGRLKRRLMPGYILIERRDLMKSTMEQGEDAIDALLNHLKIRYRSEKDEMGNVTWTGSRKEPGWIIPIATGFHGISPLGQAKNQRNPDTLHRFAESVVTLGEFIMPYRATGLDNILWHYYTDLKNNLYLCQQNTINN